METNEDLRNQIFDIIKDQMASDKPPETNLTYKRLRELGHSDLVAKQLMGQCVALELFQIIKYRKPFNEKRYVQNLRQLPEEPFE